MLWVNDMSDIVRSSGLKTIKNRSITELQDVDDTLKGVDKILKVGADGVTHEYVDESGGGLWETDGEDHIKPADNKKVLNGVGRVEHGDDASTARPNFDMVIWIGTVEPDNKLVGDIYLEEVE